MRTFVSHSQGVKHVNNSDLKISFLVGRSFFK